MRGVNMGIVKKIMWRAFVVVFVMTELSLGLVPLVDNKEEVESVGEKLDSFTKVIDRQEVPALRADANGYEEPVSILNENRDTKNFVDMSRFRSALKKIAQIGSTPLLKKNNIAINHGNDLYDQAPEILLDGDDFEVAVESEVVVPPVIVNPELKNMRTNFSSELKKIKSETLDSSLDKKIDAVAEKFDLRLSQTQKRIDAIAKRVDDVEKQQKQVLSKTNKLKKAYVEERVRREIADEVIKQQLTSD
jgi:hypothetical protein